MDAVWLWNVMMSINIVGARDFNHGIKSLSEEEYKSNEMKSLENLEHGHQPQNHNNTILSDGSLNPYATFANGETGIPTGATGGELDPNTEY